MQLDGSKDHNSRDLSSFSSQVLLGFEPANLSTQRTATVISPSVRWRFLPWLLVALVILFAAYVRFRLRGFPLERDEGEYAYVGQMILQGIPPYQLAYNMKLPGTYGLRFASDYKNGIWESFESSIRTVSACENITRI